jgi:DNA-binding transcriptional regulator YbjK
LDDDVAQAISELRTETNKSIADAREITAKIVGDLHQRMSNVENAIEALQSTIDAMNTKEVGSPDAVSELHTRILRSMLDHFPAIAGHSSDDVNALNALVLTPSEDVTAA